MTVFQGIPYAKYLQDVKTIVDVAACYGFFYQDLPPEEFQKFVSRTKTCEPSKWNQEHMQFLLAMHTPVEYELLLQLLKWYPKEEQWLYVLENHYPQYASQLNSILITSGYLTALQHLKKQGLLQLKPADLFQAVKCQQVSKISGLIQLVEKPPVAKILNKCLDSKNEGVASLLVTLTHSVTLAQATKALIAGMPKTLQAMVPKLQPQELVRLQAVARLQGNKEISKILNS